MVSQDTAGRESLLVRADSYGHTRAPGNPNHTQTRPQADPGVALRPVGNGGVQTGLVNSNFNIPMPALQNMQMGL